MVDPVFRVRNIGDLIIGISLKHAVEATGSLIYKGDDNGKKKEGDSGIRPDPPRSAGDHFPVLVIEAGNSESLRLGLWYYRFYTPPC